MAASMIGMGAPPDRARRQTARLVVAMLLGWLALSQAVDIRRTQLNTLSENGDPWGESDAIRSAEYYARYGFTAAFGLPHVAYGGRFPNKGQLSEPEPLPGDVYATYPPLPDLLCGVYAKVFGLQRIWLWRCVPALFTLAATFLLWWGLRPAVGDTAAAGVTVFASAPPMVAGYMDGLQYHAYAHALLLVELALLARIWLTGERLKARHAALLFAVGFVQGWLSLEYAFVVAGAAIPVALLARAHGRATPSRAVLVAVVSAGAGFALAELLHFVQVVAFFGSVKGAVALLGSRAAERIYGDGPRQYERITVAPGNSYVGLVALALFRYTKILWLSPNDRHFGIFLPAFTAWLVITARRAAGSPRSGELPALVWAYAIASLWLAAMPSHAIIHVHFVPRIYFLAYFVALLGVAIRYSRREMS